MIQLRDEQDDGPQPEHTSSGFEQPTAERCIGMNLTEYL
jgi:hypothetical protein